MVTKANIELLSETEGVGWITALKAPQIKKLAATGALKLSLFDQTNLAEITAEDYPGGGLVVCRNPLVGAERTRKREELLAATEQGLAQIADRVTRGTLHRADQIGLAVGPAVKRYRMKKHFDLQITDTTFTYARKTEQIAAEAALDGIYILRTSASAEALRTAEVVRAYKGLEQVERAFGSFKGPDLQIRPIHHHLEPRVRAHVLLCMLAYYLEWDMRQKLAPMLFDDTDKEAAEALRSSIVAPAQRSATAVTKQTTGVTPDGLPVHSFQTLLADLATLTRNTIVTAVAPDYPLTVTTRPTPVQRRALELLEVTV